LIVRKNNDAVYFTSLTGTSKNKFIHNVKEHCHKNLEALLPEAVKVEDELRGTRVGKNQQT